MADIRAITVSLQEDAQGQLHVCEPTSQKVNPGDRVSWTGMEPFLVFFPDKTPFEEGRGPFRNGERATVRGGLREEDSFTPQILNNGVFLKRTKGDIHP